MSVGIPEYMIDNYKYTSQFEMEIRWIINNSFLNVENAPLQRDLNEATDYILVLKLDDGDKSVGVRVRSNKFIKYSGEVCFSYGNPSYPNILSEFDKIQRGFPKYYLYGFADSNNKRLDRWVLLDMDVFRFWQQRLAYEPSNCHFARSCQSNKNGKTGKYFISFNVFNYPLTPIDNKPLIFKQHGHY